MWLAVFLTWNHLLSRTIRVARVDGLSNVPVFIIRKNINKVVNCFKIWKCEVWSSSGHCHSQNKFLLMIFQEDLPPALKELNEAKCSNDTNVPANSPLTGVACHLFQVLFQDVTFCHAIAVFVWKKLNSLAIGRRGSNLNSATSDNMLLQNKFMSTSF